MPYLRRRPKIPAQGRAPVRMTPAQRDLLIARPELPRPQGQLLHRARVGEGKLQVRFTRDELDAVIAAAIRIPAPDRAAERALDTFIDYLEDQSDRFAEFESERDVGE